MTLMSPGRDRRLDRIDRAREWDVAIAWVDRMIAWALATKRVDLMEAAGIRLQILAVMPAREDFAAGKWCPESVPPEDIQAGQVFFCEVDAWHTNQPQSKERDT
jgi:hypothetical protein